MFYHWLISNVKGGYGMDWLLIIVILLIIIADNMLTGALKSLFAVAEAYPELKANKNFLELQEELSDTEDKISYARQFYNDTVLKYNNLCEQFPSNIIAKLFHFEESEFFEAQEGTRATPKVKF